MASIAGPSRRVSFAPATTREDRLVYESSEDEDHFDEEEEEQERLLSRAHGEAAEAPASRKRGAQTDQEIEAEYEGAAQKKKRKPRVTLQPSHMLSASGLIKIRTDFSSLKFPQRSDPIDAAAAYSRALIKQYRSWAYDLFPGLALDDLLSRVETFGSRREVKAHLQQMRNEVCAAHVEQLFGKERAQRWLEELDRGLSQQHVEEEIQYDLMQPERVEEDAVVADDLEKEGDDEKNSIEQERVSAPTTRAETASQLAPLSTRRLVIDDDDSEEELEFMGPTQTALSINNHDLLDTDDEEEKDDVLESERIDNEPEKNDNEKENNDEENELMDPTQATVLATQLETQLDDDFEDGSLAAQRSQDQPEDDQTKPAQAFVDQDALLEHTQTDATQAKDGVDEDEAVDPTQATVLMEPTQATVLASQSPSYDDNEEVEATQTTVLASQFSQSATQLMKETQQKDFNES
jgi:hypothetical protein